MKHALAIVIACSAACGPKAGITETRMIHAPPRDAACKLELVTVDITSVTFNQQWDVLGYVTFLDRGAQDPFAKENRELLRPRACAMGGTSVAIAMNGMGQNAVGQQGSGVAYMVLRPKTWQAGPEAL
jgi:hypothetical protein